MPKNPSPKAPSVSTDETLTRLASAIEAQTSATKLLVDLLAVLVEAMPARVEGEILGISQPTVRENRQQRRMERLRKG